MKRIFKFDIKNCYKYMPAIVFCVFIFLMFLMFLFLPKSNYSAEEKRTLASMPEFTNEKLLSGEFGKNFENYLSDQAPFRTFFVGANAYSQLYSGHNGANGVYSGKADYLFTVPVEYNEKLDKNVSYISEFASRIKIPTYMCVVPTSGYIMQNDLPFNHYEYKDKQLINSVKSDLNKFGGNIKFIDLTDIFITKSQSEQLFYKTDHHWTSSGAFEAYNKMASEMNFIPTNKSDFKIESYDGFYGTSYSKSAFWFNNPDKIELWKNKKHTEKGISVYIKDGQKEKTSNTMFFENNIKAGDSYTAFLDGNHSYVKITNNDNKNGKKLLIIRDSYAHSIAPFLADNYSEITLIDLRYYKFSVSALIKKEKSDMVLILYGLDDMVNDTNIAYLM